MGEAISGIEAKRRPRVSLPMQIMIGVVVGGALLAGAIWFRRWRDDT